MKLFYYNSNLEQCSFNIRNYTLKVIVIVLLIGSSMGFVGSAKLNKYVEYIPLVYKHNSEEFTPDKLKVEIFKSKVKFPNIVWRQAQLESGHFNSILFTKANNIFGMRLCSSRATTQLGEFSNGFATYKNYRESLYDYMLWQAYYANDIETEEDYYRFLDKCYCTDKTKNKSYSEVLKTFK